MLTKFTRLFFLILLSLSFVPGFLWGFDTEFTGTIKGELQSYTSNRTEVNPEVEIDSTGLKKNTARTHIGFDEAELKWITAGELTEEWEASAVLDLILDQEIDEDATLTIEEASVNIENETIEFSFGIIADDLGDFLGEVDYFSIGGLDSTTVEEGIPVVRLSYLKIEELSLTAALRLYHDSGDGEEQPRTNHQQFRVELEWEQEWGMVQGVYDRRMAHVEDSNQFKVAAIPMEADEGEEDEEESSDEEDISLDAGEYRDDAQLMYAALQLYFLDEKFNPFFTYGIFKTLEKEAVKNALSVEAIETSWIVGFDWNVNAQTTVTAATNTQTRNKERKARIADGEANKDEKLVGYGVAANYVIDPLEFQLGYSSIRNNRSDLVRTEKDHHYQSFNLRVEYSF